MKLRAFTHEDTPHLIQLFRETVHQVCKNDYSPEQLTAWAPENIDPDKWNSRLKNAYTLVAENENGIAGFASLTSDGCVDMFYVATRVQGMGVGALLMNNLEIEARKLALTELNSDVSITARHFFKRMGFKIENEYSKFIGTIEFRNAIMVKKI